MPQYIVKIIKLAYVFSLVFGIPAINSNFYKFIYTNPPVALDQKKLGSLAPCPQESTANEASPEIISPSGNIAFTFPIIPFVFLSYRSYYFGPESAASGFVVDFWYIFSTKTILSANTAIS